MKKFKQFMTDAKLMKIKSSTKNKINKEINNLISPKNKTKYFDKIPIKDFIKILNRNEIEILQKDYTKWEGWLLGNNSKTSFILADIKSLGPDGSYTSIYANTLELQWYKMQSGRYEINGYVS